MIKPKNNFKAVISIILLFLVHTFANAQYFTATPDGLRNSTNMKEKFVVIEIPDLSVYSGQRSSLIPEQRGPFSGGDILGLKGI